MGLVNVLFGRPLASSEDQGQRITPAQGIPTFGLDALSSAAYGPRSGADRSPVPWSCRRPLYRSFDGRHHRLADHRVFQLSADHRRVSGRRGLLHGGEGEPGTPSRLAGGGGADDRLFTERRGGDLGRDWGVGLRRTFASEVHLGLVSGSPGDSDHREPARRLRCWFGFHRAHISLCRHVGHRDRDGSLPSARDRRPSGPIDSTPTSDCGNRNGWAMAATQSLCEWLHSADREWRQ